MHHLILIQVDTDRRTAEDLADDVTFYLDLDERTIKSTLVLVGDITPPVAKTQRVIVGSRPNQAARINLAKEIPTGTRAGNWYYLPGAPEPEPERDSTQVISVPHISEMTAADLQRHIPPSYEVQRLQRQVWSLTPEEQDRFFWEMLRGRK